MTKESENSSSRKSIRRDMLKKLLKVGDPDKKIWSDKIAARLLQLKQWNESDVVCCFHSLPEEVNTTKIIETALYQEKELYLPRLNNQTMSFFRFFGDSSELLVNSYGIKEPFEKSQELISQLKDKTSARCLVVVPGVVFTTRGNRLGRGGGYYDRFISDIKNKYRNKKLLFSFVGICFSLQLSDKIPLELHDQEMDAIITELDTYRCSQ